MHSSLSIAIPTIILKNLIQNVNRFNAFYLQTAGKERKTYERVKNHRLNVLFNAVSEIKFPEGKYGHMDTHYFIVISFQIFVNMQKQPFIS